MKKLILSCAAALLFIGCAQKTTSPENKIKDGFYQAMQLGSTAEPITKLATGQVQLGFDTLFNSGDYTLVAVDTLDYVPLELATLPRVEKQTDLKKLLSITLTPAAAKKMRTFSAQRVSKHVVVVIDGKAITMHMIRAAITGNDMQITRCDDNACEYLYVKMKDNVTP